jgi:hypothetical protein
MFVLMPGIQWTRIILWDLNSSRRLLWRCARSVDGGSSCLHHQGSRYSWNVGKLIPDYATQQISSRIILLDCRLPHVNCGSVPQLGLGYVLLSVDDLKCVILCYYLALSSVKRLQKCVLGEKILRREVGTGFDLMFSRRWGLWWWWWWYGFWRYIDLSVDADVSVKHTI